jgi:hypothetical protein
LILPDIRSLFPPAHPAGAMLISMARMMPVSLAVYDLEIFTILYLLSSPLLQVFGGDVQKKLTD